MSLVFLLGFGGFWFGFVGYGILLGGQEWTVTSVIFTFVVGAVGCLFVALIVKGGVWYFEINDEGVRWYGPFENEVMIRDADVDSFEVVHSGNESPTRSVRAFLKNGGVVTLPDHGDSRVIHRLLLDKWRYRGSRHE